MKTISRFVRVCALLIPPFIAFAIARHNPYSKRFQSCIVQIRISLQTLGGGFIKLGQLLSARPDIIGPELSSELRNLLDREEPLPPQIIKKTIESELKRDLEEIFSSFEEEPLSTASIGQVHKATLKNGKKVAVKVQKKGIAEAMKKDLALFGYVARLLDLLIARKGLQFHYAYEEFAVWITNELDFEVEGRRADKFYQNMKEVAGITIPKVYWQYSTSKVLVMSFVEGLTLNAILDEMKKQNVDTMYDVKLPYRINPDLLVEIMVGTLVRQALVDKFFHGDLHPANIIIQKNNKIALVDFGIVGILDNEEKTKLLFILLALIDNDTASLIKVIASSSLESLSDEQIKTLYQQFSRELHRLHEESIGEISISHFIMLFLSLTSRYNIVWSSGLVLGTKSVSQIDSIAKQVGIKIPVVNLIKTELEKYISQVFSSGFTKELFYKTVLEIVETGRRLPETLSELEELIKNSTISKAENVVTIKRNRINLKTLVLLLIAIALSVPIVSSSIIASLPYNIVFVLAIPLLLFYILNQVFSS